MAVVGVVAVPVSNRAVGPAAVAAESDAVPTERIASAILARVNSERAAFDLPPLFDADEARLAAIWRAWDMASAGYLGHQSPAGLSVEDVLQGQGVGTALVGENVARCNADSALVESAVWSSWMNSPAHRDNILDSRFTRVGVGVVMLNGWYYVSLVFLD
jgi:uncharacterized protein YkwD